MGTLPSPRTAFSQSLSVNSLGARQMGTIVIVVIVVIVDIMIIVSSMFILRNLIILDTVVIVATLDPH